MPLKHALHEGELRLQRRRGAPIELSNVMPDYIERDMPRQHADFFEGLPYLPLGTLDSEGRPWASILVTASTDDPSLGVQVSGANQTHVIAETNPYDPFLRALKNQEGKAIDGKQLFAGVGVDFSNRRRNKFAGSIDPLSIAPNGKVSLRLTSDQHLGNCPKYITVRSLEHKTREAKLVFDLDKAVTTPFPDAAKTLIDRASTAFLATKHLAKEKDAIDDQTDMGFNHRGGAPGFVRLYEEKEGDSVTTYLVLPDHSGNRFYQSLGNIETDKQVGLVFPDFTTGDVLYVTGEAENLYDRDAEGLMPRVRLLTRIKVTGAVFVEGGLNLQLISDEQYSPYNPPVKYLRSELEALGRVTAMSDATSPISATLVSMQSLSKTVSTFTFELSSSVSAPLPGGFGVFDFSKVLNAGYHHMSEANPQLVNEDYVRTWTFSNAANFNATTNRFSPISTVSITVKHKPGGLMSTFLHQYAAQLIERKALVEFKGTGAGFSCFTPTPNAVLPTIPTKMLWIAGGVGITPFMSMWDGIINVAKMLPKHVSSDITMLYAGRDDDINILKHFLTHSESLPEKLSLRILAFQSVGGDTSNAQEALDTLREEFPDASLTMEQRRIEHSDLEALTDLKSYDIYLCGPEALTRWSATALRDLGVRDSKLHQESFFF